ncbi:MAG TPA: TIGR02266 family protein [Polyangiaceae bacterium]|nr:TIGR02266 family protein [Polyangiaceae bacterium]
MESAPPSSFPAGVPARRARELLVAALGLLQRDRAKAPELSRATESAASASSALYDAEKTATTPQAATAGIRIAIEQLGASLAALHQYEQQSGAHPATESVARTLALLYPVARASLRQRRDVMLDSDQDSAAIESLRALAQIPPAPEPFGRPRKDTPPFEGKEHRKRGERVFLEVDIGLLSESYFYTGLSQDLSRGGVFVATYQLKAPGTRVSVYFVLPDGHAVSADGVVRWTRDAGSEDLPPGMGIAFENLPERDVTAINRYCHNRAPLYHDIEDD